MTNRDSSKTMLSEMSSILYTHTSYKDVWPLFLGQWEKHFSLYQNCYAFVNESDGDMDLVWNERIYDEDRPYRLRVVECLDDGINPGSEFCLFMHEDMILYKNISVNMIETILHFMKDSPGVDCVKLCKGGDTVTSQNAEHPYLHQIMRTSPWIFSIQPSIWRKSSLWKLYNEVPGKTIWEFETNAQDYCRQAKNKMLIYHYYNDEPKRGRLHWDSDVFPYMNAISKGKWIMSEYKTELGPLLNEYGMDAEIRGTN